VTSNNNNKAATKLDTLFARGVAVAAIIGIPAGVYGYFSSQHDMRVETAFTLYKSLKDDRIQNEWSLLVDRWNAIAPEVTRLQSQHDQKGFETLTIKLVKNDQKSRIALEEIASLFDEVSACVENGICDHNTVYAMLKDPADQFVGMYGYYIQYVRSTYSNDKYGTGLFKIRAIEKKFNLFEWL
jgi:hypothetical protein